ncbi:MAG: protein TolR [Chromatiales bacterium]|nr:protein TolR [Chromatiales bacterium]
MSRQKKSRRPMAEINVVPYIDVMLVLLVIFMITAPLLTQGVNVELPEADANPIESTEQETVVVSVNLDGDLFIDIGEGQDDQPIAPEDLVTRVAAVLKYKPKTAIMVKGDKDVAYQKVIDAMVLIQKAGAPNVGLITETPEGS